MPYYTSHLTVVSEHEHEKSKLYTLLRESNKVQKNASLTNIQLEKTYGKKYMGNKLTLNLFIMSYSR